MTEREIQKQIIDVCRASNYRVFRMNAGMGKRGQHLAPPGTPDLLVIGFNGKVTWVEVKSADGKLNADQETMHGELRFRGQKVVVARGIEDLPWLKS